MIMEKDVCCVGRKKFLVGFKLAGVKRCYELGDEEKMCEGLKEKLEDLINDASVGLIIVEEKCFNMLEERDREKYESLPMPIVLPLGKKIGASETLRRKIMETIGIDLFR